MVLTYLLICIAPLLITWRNQSVPELTPANKAAARPKRGVANRTLALLALVTIPAQALDTAGFENSPFPATQTSPPVLLILGDSLSAAYGIELSESWPALLKQRLQINAPETNVVNASISGETTNGGLRRLPALLAQHQPTAVIVELGANDGLRGQSLKTMKKNLLKITTKSQEAGAAVLLLGMYIPSNYGRAYVEKFHAIYGDLAKQTGSGLVDFMLEPIAFDESNFLDDRIHPNAEAQPLLLDHLWPSISKLLAKTTSK